MLPAGGTSPAALNASVAPVADLCFQIAFEREVLISTLTPNALSVFSRRNLLFSKIPMSPTDIGAWTGHVANKPKLDAISLRYSSYTWGALQAATRARCSCRVRLNDAQPLFVSRRGIT